jgi:hypothetical protein
LLPPISGHKGKSSEGNSGMRDDWAIALISEKWSKRNVASRVSLSATEDEMGRTLFI